VIGLALSILTVASCDFIRWSSSDTLGLFARNFGDGCERDTSKDFTLRLGQVLGVVQCILLFFSLIGMTFIIFVLRGHAGKGAWVTTNVLYSVSLPCAIGVFGFFLSSGYSSDNLGTAGIANVLNIVLLIGVVSMCWCVPVQKAPKCPNSSGLPTVTDERMASDSPIVQNPLPRTVVTRTIQQTPEGRLTVEEILYPDGTKRITKTLERQVQGK
jgi:hypothetical protein